MSFLDKFEKSVENAMSTVFSKFGAKDIKPVDIVVAMRAELDNKVMEVGNGRKVAPNHFRLVLSTPDFDKVETWGPQEFANELAASIEAHGESESYSFIGAVDVIFEENTDNEAGEYQIYSEAIKGEDNEPLPGPPIATESGAAYTNLSQQSDQELNPHHPTLELGGKRYILTEKITVIGRGSDCDIILEDSGVSRHHLELRLTKHGTIASDMGSTNGIFIEGHQTQAATLVNGNTVTIGSTKIIYWEPPKVLQPVETTTPPQSLAALASNTDGSLVGNIPAAAQNLSIEEGTY
jgi:hypothetical protein